MVIVHLYIVILKKTGFIILNGKASVQIGIYKKNIKIYNSLSRLVLRPGLFHSLKAVSKKGLTALEFETPYDKNDLVRFEDRYGREKKIMKVKNILQILQMICLNLKNQISAKK